MPPPTRLASRAWAVLKPTSSRISVPMNTPEVNHEDNLAARDVSPDLRSPVPARPRIQYPIGVSAERTPGNVEGCREYSPEFPEEAVQLIIDTALDWLPVC